MPLSRRYPATVATAALIALGAAACGNSSTASTPQASSGPASSSASAMPSGMPSAMPSPTPTATIAKLTGVDTQVTLDPSTAAVLKGNSVSVMPVAPATASMTGGNTVVAFPITGGRVSLFDKSVQAQGIPWIQGEVDHSGGLTFTAGGKMLTATDFVVDPGKSVLTAMVGGNRVPLFFLDGSNVAVSKDAAGHVLLDGTVAKLTQQAADALNQTFGVTLFKQYIPVGTVHLTAAG